MNRLEQSERPRKVKISKRIDLTEVTSPPHPTIDLSSAPLSPIIKADSRGYGQKTGTRYKRDDSDKGFLTQSPV
jgi:hypothetical protein